MSRHYAAAGVNLDTAERAKSRIAELVRRTRTPLALGELGAFGGMVRLLQFFASEFQAVQPFV